MKIAIIGGGASGMFAAANIGVFHPDSEVTVFEKKSYLLAKVRVSGGGRCNLSHASDTVDDLLKAYPRGANSLKRVLHQFDNRQTMDWFESHGLKLVVQSDGCVFPASQDAMSVVNLLLQEAGNNKTEIRLKSEVTALYPEKEGFRLKLKASDEDLLFDKVIVTTGGISSLSGLEWLKKLGHEIVVPAPSLFTFNLQNNPITQLMGLVVNPVKVSITGTNISCDGPLLITHWGFSGPAILKLSAFGARYLFEQQYSFSIRINWTGHHTAETLHQELEEIIRKDGQKKLVNRRPGGIPLRLWEHLLQSTSTDAGKLWQNLGHRSVNQLVDHIINARYEVKGKTTFREEFVTSGGISLQSVHMPSLGSKVCPGLYFAGEILNIDGLTGGYNLQAAWSTGYVASMLK